MSKIEIAPVDIITTELAKNNLTEAVLEAMKNEYMPLTINGIEDKEGYKAVREARIKCKNTRVLATKICKAGREEAVRVQKDWIEAEKRVTGPISEIEKHLQDQEDAYDAEKDRIKKEAEEKEHKRIQARVQQLIDNGCVFDGVSYNIGEISMSGSDVQACNDEVFAEAIAAVITERDRLAEEKRVEEARLQAEREEEERLHKEEEERLAKERENLARLQKEQAEKEASLRAEQEQLAKEREELKRQKIKSRNRQLMDLGLHFCLDGFSLGNTHVSEHDIVVLTDEEWNDLIYVITPDIKNILDRVEEEAREAKRKEAEAAAEEEDKKRKQAAAYAEAEKKRLEALRPDKEKLMAYAESLGAVQMPDLTSDEANAILNSAVKSLENIKNFITQKVNTL